MGVKEVKTLLRMDAHVVWLPKSVWFNVEKNGLEVN